MIRVDGTVTSSTQNKGLIIKLNNADREYYIAPGTRDAGLIVMNCFVTFEHSDALEFIAPIGRSLLRVANILSITPPSHTAPALQLPQAALPPAAGARRPASPIHVATASSASQQSSSVPKKAKQGSASAHAPAQPSVSQDDGGFLPAKDDLTATKRYEDFCKIINRDKASLMHEPGYTKLLAQANISHEANLYFPHDSDVIGKTAVEKFLTLFFGRNSDESLNWREIHKLHEKKATDQRRTIDVSCVSFLNVSINRGQGLQRICFVSPSGSGVYKNPELYFLLRQFIRSRQRDLTHESSGIVFHIVDHTGDGPQAFNNLIQETLAIIYNIQPGMQKPAGVFAEAPQKACAEKGLVSTLTKLIARYGINTPTNPNGVNVHSSFNVSFYPRNINMVTNAYQPCEKDKLPINALSIPRGKVAGELKINRFYFPLYFCCDKNCVRNKDAVKLILAIAINAGAELNLSPLRSDSLT